MNEEERADWLARAIDDLLSRDRQRPTESPPPELERQELNSLLRIAGDRLDTAETKMQGLQYEGEVWRGVLRKLDRRRKPRKKTSATRTKIVPNDQFVLERNLDRFEIDELRQIAKMRRQLAEQAATIAEAHRDDVWQRVQSRASATPQAKPGRSWRLSFFWLKRREDRPAAAAVPEYLRKPDADGRDEMESLLDLASARSYLSELSKASAAEREQRVWGGLTRTIKRDKRNSLKETDRADWWPGLSYGAALVAFLLVAFGKRVKKDERDEQMTTRSWRPRAAAAAVMLAVVVAAVAPLPATGFADHPAVDFGRSIGERVGVRETNVRPPAAGSELPTTLAGREVTLSEASDLIGGQLREPTTPEGFELRASHFFDGAITADSGGAYALTYVGPEDASLVVFQERPSGVDLSAEGPATDVMLNDGTAATYLQGVWQPVDGEPIWNAGAGQTLVFERDGVRTTVQYTGPEATAPSLFAVANSMITGR